MILFPDLFFCLFSGVQKLKMFKPIRDHNVEIELVILNQVLLMNKENFRVIFAIAYGCCFFFLSVLHHYSVLFIIHTFCELYLDVLSSSLQKKKKRRKTFDMKTGGKPLIVNTFIYTHTYTDVRNLYCIVIFFFCDSNILPHHLQFISSYHYFTAL